jgi:TonB family protein
VLGSIKANFVWGQDSDPELAAVIAFSILADGSVSRVRPVESSGNLHFDRAAINAVRSTVDLGPPPEKYRGDFGDFELKISAGDASHS